MRHTCDGQAGKQTLTNTHTHTHVWTVRQTNNPIQSQIQIRETLAEVSNGVICDRHARSPILPFPSPIRIMHAQPSIWRSTASSSSFFYCSPVSYIVIPLQPILGVKVPCTFLWLGAISFPRVAGAACCLLHDCVCGRN